MTDVITTSQIEPILDDFLGVDCPHYEELRKRCAQRIVDLYANSRAASEWRDISTAPRDGTIVDLWSGVRLPNCRWESSSYAHDIPWGWGNSSFGRILNATHWMPLPAPPQRNEVTK